MFSASIKPYHRPAFRSSLVPSISHLLYHPTQHPSSNLYSSLQDIMSPGHGKQAHLDLADSTNSTTKQGNVDDIKAHFEGLSTREHDDLDRPRSHSGSQVSSIPHMQEGRASVYSSDNEISESEDDARENDHVVNGDESPVIGPAVHRGQASSNHSSDLVVYKSRPTSPHVVPASKDHPSTGPDHSKSDRKVGFTPSTKERRKRTHRRDKPRSDKPRSADDTPRGHHDERSHSRIETSKTGTGRVSS